jgi:hypothetical protein
MPEAFYPFQNGYRWFVRQNPGGDRFTKNFIILDFFSATIFWQFQLRCFFYHLP